MKKLNIDKVGYESTYRDKLSPLYVEENFESFLEAFSTSLLPFHEGGGTKGFVRGLAVRKLFNSINLSYSRPEDVVILDCGCGLGELSIYLALQGYNVIGIDVSEQAIRACKQLAQKFGVEKKCEFLATSLEKTNLQDQSISFVIGLASLHHFIKYPDIPDEFLRILKSGGRGFFADSFGENKVYHLFQNNKFMKEHGDVNLTKVMIEKYFTKFQVELTPTDWFVMFDKLYEKILPKDLELLRRLSKIHFKIDRMINFRSRRNLFLSGSLVTEIKKI